MQIITFSVKPDYKILNRYFLLPSSVAVMEEQYSEGYNFNIELYDSEDAKQIIEQGIEQLTKDYQIHEHKDNLMFIILNYALEYYLHLSHTKRTNDYALLHKELALTLLFASQSTILLKTSLGSYTISHGKVSQVISNALKEAVMSIPLVELGEPSYLFKPVGTVNDEELLKSAQAKVKPTNEVIAMLKGKLNTEFCLFLYSYLDQETKLTSGEGVTFSDKQLSFLYELLVLMSFMDPRTFNLKQDYSPKDYMRGNLMAYIKKLKRSGKRAINNI